MKGLKGLLQLVGFGALAYVAAIAAVIAIRIGPTARALRAHSEQVRQEYQAINDRSTALYATIDEIQIWLYTAARPSAMKPGPDILRRRIDSLTAPAGAPRLSQIPTSMRVEFTESSVEQSKLGILLIEVLENIEQGRMHEAQQQLAMADSIARSADRHLAAAQRVGLDDLIAREQSLAGAARASVQAIGIWAALGLLIAPFVVVFLRRRFYAPLADLTDGIQQVADGDLTWTIPVRHSDELGRVSEHFNRATLVMRQRGEEMRQRASAALQQSEERYESMVEYAPIGIAVVDPAGRYVHTNPAFRQFLGYSEEELNGKHFRDVTVPEDVDASEERFAGLKAGRYDRYRLEKCYRRKDGTEVWARVAIAGVRDAAGALVHTVSMIEDITEEKQLSAAAREAQQRFRAVVSGAPIALFGIDVNGIITVTEGIGLAGLGLKPGEAVGESIFERLRDAPNFAEPFRLALAGRMFHGIGTYRGTTIEAWVSPMRDPNGRVTGAIGVSTDVSDRVRAEAERHKSEEKFATAFRMSPNPSVMSRLEDGLLVDVNDAYCKATGFTREEVLGKSARDALWPDPARREDFLRQLRQEGRVRDLELQMRTKAGPPLDVLVSVETIELDGVMHTLGAAVDITERKKAAEALRESEERYRSLVEASPDAITVVQDGRLVFANPAALELMHGTERDLIGHLAIDYVSEEDRARCAARLDDVLAGMKDVFEEVRLRRVDGTLIEVEATGILIQFEGRPAVLVIQRDVTARKHAEQQLRLLAQAVKSTTEAISITDADGRFTFVNLAFLQDSGYTEQEVLGQLVSLVDSPRNRPGLQEEIRLATQRGTWSGELYNRRKDGTDFLISLTTAQVKDNEGRVIALMGVSSDVTERKQLQDSVRRAETMAALGAVVAGVAHEVRNPLFGISATVDAFEARFGTDATQARYTKTLRQEVSRLTKLMQDLLEYGKPPRLEITVGPIAPVVRRAVAANSSLAENSGVWVRAELPDDLPAIPMDQSRIQQVFQNLIDNAIQHSPRGSTVTITGARRGSAEYGVLDITIADQGTGFKDEDLSRLFEPFFTRRRGGTGLGLSIVQRILEQHDGDILAHNGDAGGAVITVRLPLSRERRRRSEPARV